MTTNIKTWPTTTERMKNRYPGPCCVCKTWVAEELGYLYLNNKNNYLIKCERCHSEKPKRPPQKHISATFIKKLLQEHGGRYNVTPATEEDIEDILHVQIRSPHLTTNVFKWITLDGNPINRHWISGCPDYLGTDSFFNSLIEISNIKITDYDAMHSQPLDALTPKALEVLEQFVNELNSRCPISEFYLLDFIKEYFSDLASKSLGLIPVYEICDLVQSKWGKFYSEEEFKSHLFKLRLLNKIELRTTKSMFAKNLGIKLIEIEGIQYGFLKLFKEQK